MRGSSDFDGDVVEHFSGLLDALYDFAVYHDTTDYQYNFDQISDLVAGAADDSEQIMYAIERLAWLFAMLCVPMEET